jgi:hypothetical protein
MVTSLATPQAALDSRFTDPRMTVYVGGVTVIAEGYTCQHTIGETATGAPREGLRVDFYAGPPGQDVHATTDAGGSFNAELEVGASYSIPVMNAVTVNGQILPAGTVLRIVVPEGEGPVEVAELIVDIIDASPPALLAMIEELTARVAALESPPETP